MRCVLVAFPFTNPTHEVDENNLGRAFTAQRAGLWHSRRRDGGSTCLPNIGYVRHGRLGVPRPRPTQVLHFTRIEHLSSILANGLLSDSTAQARGLLTVEIGNRDIKAQRMRRVVPIPPAGTVSDYVPFYFAPRSPMMYAIHRGNVPTYQDGCGRLIYLVSSLEKLEAAALEVLVTDRNAALSFAEFEQFGPTLSEELVDWELMKAPMWNNTPAFPDRRERRMAECLVYGGVPWPAFAGIAVRTEAIAAEVREIVAAAALDVEVRVRPGWYF